MDNKELEQRIYDLEEDLAYAILAISKLSSLPQEIHYHYTTNKTTCPLYDKDTDQCKEF